MTLYVYAALFEDDLDTTQVLVDLRPGGPISIATLPTNRRQTPFDQANIGAPSRIRTCDTRFRNFTGSALRDLAKLLSVCENPGQICFDHGLALPMVRFNLPGF